MEDGTCASLDHTIRSNRALSTLLGELNTISRRIVDESMLDWVGLKAADNTGMNDTYMNGCKNEEFGR